MGSAIARDLRFAVKALRRAPGFTVIAIITLGLGIGANTSAFSILNALLLRPLPYRDSERLERIYRATAQDSRGGVSPADYLDLEAELSGYGAIAAYGVVEMSLSEPGQPADLARGLRISADLFSTLGTGVALGRPFRPDEEIRGNHRVLILSHRYWQNRFAGDSQIVGRTVRVDGQPHEIVGVLPADLNDWRHLGPFDLYRPLGFTDQEAADRAATSLRLVGRRARNLSPEQAEALIAGFGRRRAADHPAVHAETTWRTLPIYDAAIPENAKGIVGMLIGLSAFVLLIACSNLANLMLAGTVARAREFAVRGALGASRGGLLRPLVFESLLLALAGGLCAVLVATWSHDWLNAFADPAPGDPVIFALDWRVMSWAFIACLGTALAFGFAPGLFALRLDLNGTLKSGARGATAAQGHRRFRQVLIAGQFALAMVLLAGAAMFVRGLHEWNNRRFGWDSDQLITGTLLLPATTYPDTASIAEFHRLALARLEALPGVGSASISYSMPFFGMGEPRRYLIAGQEVPRRGREPVAVTNGVSPGYFTTIGTPLLSGRAFDRRDTPQSPRVFIINQAMAHGLFGGENPLGRRIARVGGETQEWGEIVGVVGDIQAIGSDRLAVTYQVYQPMAQEPWRASEIAVRTEGLPPGALVGSIRTTMMALDPDLPVRQLQSVEAAIATATNYQTIIGRILSFLALLGLGLACLGVYGVITRTTAQRTGEFGIRLALGAASRDITRLVLTAGAKLALIGSAVGVAGAFAVTRLIVAQFPGLETSNVPVLAGVTVLLIAIAQLACYLPARRAARISPTEALRAE